MIIYKTTNIVNGKIYIGQTRSKDASYLGSGLLIKMAIDKYGKSNFIRETICECSSQEELDNMERYLINELNSRNLDIGYNICEGGLGGSYGPLPESQKQKISKTMISRGSVVGVKNPFYGKCHTDESKEKIAKSKLGTKLSEEHKLKIGKSAVGKTRKNKGKPLSSEHIQKLKDGQAKRKSLGLKKKSPAPFSNEHKLKLSEAAKRQWKNKEKRI